MCGGVGGLGHTAQGGGIDLRFLRLARVFRVFKLSRYGHRMQLIVDALQESREILLMLSVNLVILIVVFSPSPTTRKKTKR